MSKTPEMVAMDRWFSRSDDLERRYRNVIERLAQVLPADSEILRADPEVSKAGKKVDPLTHFGEHWINRADPQQGGTYWPQIATTHIIEQFQAGFSQAARKGLGWTSPEVEHPEDLFNTEIRAGLTTTDLTGVVPLLTCWTCPNEPGHGDFFGVQSVRGLTAVEVLIVTPGPLVHSG